MRPKFLIMLLGSALLVLMIVWLLSPRNVEKAASQSNEAQKISKQSAPVSALGARPLVETQKLTQVEHSVSATNGEEPEIEKEWRSIPANQSVQARMEELAQRRGVSLEVLTQQALVEWSNTTAKAFDQMNQPIEFYGTVVDESNQPIGSAVVHLGCMSYPENYFTTNFLTDAQGAFVVNNLTGTALDVSVTKEGYREMQGTNQNHFRYYSPTGKSFQPAPLSPVVFHLRKKN